MLQMDYGPSYRQEMCLLNDSWGIVEAEYVTTDDCTENVGICSRMMLGCTL